MVTSVEGGEKSVILNNPFNSALIQEEQKDRQPEEDRWQREGFRRWMDEHLLHLWDIPSDFDVWLELVLTVVSIKFWSFNLTPAHPQPTLFPCHISKISFSKYRVWVMRFFFFFFNYYHITLRLGMGNGEK